MKLIKEISCQVYLGGYHGDCSKTFLIGNVDEHGRKLIEVSELCLSNAIEACKPYVPFSIIGMYEILIYIFRVELKCD